jgi:phosphoribosylanthranilate isomerase
VTRIKICGLTQIEDVVQASHLGVDAVGFVLEPTSPRYVSPARAEELAGYLGPYITSVAVYGRTKSPIPNLMAVQALEFRHRPRKIRVQTVRVTPQMTRQELDLIAGSADAILLDAYSPHAYGGTGEKVDWHHAAELIRHLTIPTILAGGLTPDNVADAIQIVRPYAVDVSSGVESAPGIKDPAKMRDFITGVRSLDP